MQVSLPTWLADVHVVQLRLRKPFRGLISRETALVRGPAGWAEWGPFVEYGDEEAATWLRATLDVATTGFPAPQRDVVSINATVPAVPAADVPEVLARFAGASTVKVKVAEPGQCLADDVARLEAVRSTVGPSAAIRVDANAAWSLAEARAAVDAFADIGLEYIEQPVESLTDMATLCAEARARREAGRQAPRIAADESIRKVGDPLAVARAGAADVAVVKMPPLGGPTRALATASALADLGVDVVFSSALDSAIGLSAGVATAAAHPGLERACGLGTSRLFAEDIAEPLAVSDGHIEVPTTSPEPLEGALAQYAAPADRHRWWRDRLERCYALLPAVS